MSKREKSLNNQKINQMLGAQLRKLRIRAKKSRARMANQLGVSEEDILKLETGVRPLMTSHLFTMAWALGLTHQEFVEKLFQPIEEARKTKIGTKGRSPGNPSRS